MALGTKCVENMLIFSSQGVSVTHAVWTRTILHASSIIIIGCVQHYPWILQRPADSLQHGGRQQVFTEVAQNRHVPTDRTSSDIQLQDPMCSLSERSCGCVGLLSEG